MTTQQRNVALAHAIVPRAPRLPTDMATLHGAAVLAWCPVRSVARQAQADYIATLISETLASKGAR